jgi:hypothetical protein
VAWDAESDDRGALRGCEFRTAPSFEGASLRSLALSGSTVPGLLGRQLTTAGDVRLDEGFRATGEVALTGAHVGGDLVLARQPAFGSLAEHLLSQLAKFPRSDYVSGSSRLAGATTAADTEDAEDDLLYNSLTQYVDSLRKSAKILALVHDSSASYADFGQHGDDVRDRTAALRRSGSVASFYPIILATRLRNEHDHKL